MSRNEGAGDQIVGHDEDLAMQGITLRLDRGPPQITRLMMNVLNDHRGDRGDN